MILSCCSGPILAFHTSGLSWGVGMTRFEFVALVAIATLALAVGIPRRSPILPDVPALAEVLPGYEKDGSYALLAPAKTPRAILGKISKDTARALDDMAVKQKLQTFGFVPAPTTPEEHDRILRAQIETFSKVVRVAGLRAP